MARVLNEPVTVKNVRVEGSYAEGALWKEGEYLAKNVL